MDAIRRNCAAERSGFGVRNTEYGSFIALSNRNHEPYAQAEFYIQPGQCKPGKKCRKLGWIFSADIRNRTVYQYIPAPDATQVNLPEPSEVSVNILAGARQVRSGAGLLGSITPTYYLRYYHGVNPNGQFRSSQIFKNTDSACSLDCGKRGRNDQLQFRPNPSPGDVLPGQSGDHGPFAE